MPEQNVRPLKIGLILDTSLDPPDGVQQYVIAIGEWLRTQGHHVHYLVGQTARTDLPNIHSLSRNMTVTFNGNRTTIPRPTSKRKLREFIQKEQFDVLHVQTPHHPLMSQRLILAAGPQTVVIGTFHILPYGRLASWANKALGWWLRPSLKRFDKMLAVSQAAADFEKQTFGLQAEVLPNVIDLPRFADAAPFERDDKLQLLFLGRLVPRKGCDVLLRALAQLDRAALPPFRLIICGKGAMQPQLEAYVREHGLADIVEFTGFVTEEDKPHYYASADISLFPSSAGESFGIVLLEAMASGKAAVLAGDNPGYRSVVAEEAQLFDPLDDTQLAEKLMEYIQDAAKRQQIADIGKAHTTQYDVSVVGAKLLNIYQDLLSAKKMQ
jgi:phosphatidylinositol alpha-mannosyltransferase